MEKNRAYKKNIWIGTLFMLVLMICCTATVSAKTAVRTEKKTLYYGQTLSLKFSEKAKWSTSNKKIVTVKPKRNGKSAVLKAKRAGTATITVKLKKETIRYKFTVKNNSLSKTSLTLNAGEQSALVVKGKTGTIKVKVSDPSVVTAKVVPNKKIRITAKKAGHTNILITVNKKTLKCRVTVKGKTVVPEKPQQEQESNVKYSYEVCFFGQPYAGGVNTPIFIKTNAPEKSGFCLELYDAAGNKVPLSYVLTEYDDMKPQNDISKLLKVDGGYVATLELKRTGTFTVKITETSYINTKPASVILGKITVLNEATAKKEWIRSVISKATTSSMTKPEKMRAVCEYLYNHSRYLKNYVDGNGQLHYLSLITDEGIPDWVRGEWSSYTSPKLLEEFGAELGYKVKSLYNAFPSGSEEWYQYHYCAQATEDGELYSICHVSETNCYTDIRSKENIPKIDFKNYPKYYLRLR